MASAAITTIKTPVIKSAEGAETPPNADAMPVSNASSSFVMTIAMRISLPRAPKTCFHHTTKAAEKQMSVVFSIATQSG
jgi:hypothetical protein